MPAVRHPCLQCKEKHVKCDEERPRCRRCQSKLLPCTRPSKKTVFRHGSAANFSSEQKWVNSEVRDFRFHAQGAGPSAPDEENCETQSSSESPNLSTPMTLDPQDSIPTRDPQTAPASDFRQPEERSKGRSAEIRRFQGSDLHKSPGSDPSPQSTPDSPFVREKPATDTDGRYTYSMSWQGSAVSSSAEYSSSHTNHPPHIASPHEDHGTHRRFPLEDVQEACLLRYFVEEIAHWFDLCDENRHFQLVVPQRAHHHPHLLNAIFAVAARHLSRLPQYKTSRGILYHGQLLPNLSEHDAVEYMLKCIPALRHFHDIDDDDYRDSIIATAVILRQLEEIDDEEDDTEGLNKQINFLSIINAVLRSSKSQTLFSRRSLIQAAYWMALRQEIYHSLTRRQPPQLIPTLDLWQSASNANKTVMHTIQVAKWCWEDGSQQEWTRLMNQQGHLERDILCQFQPIFKRPADKTKGEIFPIIWYGSNIEVTSIQQSIMAKSVLVAENPSLKEQSALRVGWRRAENEVRLLLLDLCGIALCHPASPPALLNAAIGIQLYGDFFTDSYERQALRGVVEKYRDARAWPVQRLLEMFKE